MKITFKTKAVIETYAQVLFAIFAFALMIVFSYVFVRNIEHEHLKNNAKITLFQMQTNIASNLQESETVLDNIAETIHNMVFRKIDFEEIKMFISDFTNITIKEKKTMQNIINIYGVFDAYNGEFFSGAERNFQKDSVQSSAWYKAAFNTKNEIAIVNSHFDASLNAVIVTFVRRIFDRDGKQICIIFMDVNFNKTANYIVRTQLNKNSFGLMLNSELEMIAHPSSAYLGMKLQDMNVGIAPFLDELRRGEDIFERNLINYKGEEAITFLKSIENNWFIGIVTPRDEYYENINDMAKFLSALGIALALVLSVVLIRLNKAKGQANALIHKQNQELNERNHWYESILDAVPFSVSAQDKSARWTFINASFEAVLKKKRKDVIGLPCCDSGFSICGNENCAITCAKRGQMQTRFAYNGASYQVDVKILKDLKNNNAGYIEVIQDVTLIEQAAKAEAESANKAKSAFLAKMSHEIRTPMNAILGTAEIQLQNENLDPQIKESFMMVFNSSNLLLGIINNILDLSKIESGKMELMPSKYEISSLINDTVQLNIMRNSSKKVKFELNIEENVPIGFLGDEIRIKQILNNLLSNAFKYTEKGKVELSISAETKGLQTMLVFKVSDTGQGMTEEQTSKLFTNEFIRFNMETNRSIEGTGLGISIVYHLAQMMHGEVSVESELGKGSVFTVRLPQEKINAQTLDKEMVENLQNFRSKSSSQLKRIHFLREPMPYGKVLVVDDVESNLYVAKGLMAPYGLSIDIASSGFEAIDKIKEGKVYDIIFMDHMMPKMDGIEATKIIRKLGYTRFIVALTANALLDQVKIFFENGFDDFIPKPIDIRQLNSVLNKLIRDKHPPEVIAKAQGKKRVTETLPNLLSIFALDAKRALPVLESTLENVKNATDNDLNLFTINAHGIKSALANIGESELSHIAFALEKAGKEKDRDTIAKETQKLVDSLKEIVAKAEKEEQHSFGKDEDPVFLREQLKAICDACESYNSREASFRLSDLKKKQWAGKTNEFLDQIQECLLLSDFEEAKAKVLEFLKG
jgi:signal transduction histidine kinase/DNA-binding response OmpR family regulator